MTTGVLLMSYGSPESPADVERYYTDVRRGRPPTPEQLADLRRRYDAIGGLSPLARRTRDQAAGVQRALDEAAPGAFRVFCGTKHSRPSIEEGVRAVARAGLPGLVALVLAPHYSPLSVGEYLDRARAEGARAGVDLRAVESWHLEPGLVAALATRLRVTLDEVGTPPDRTEVLVTAHSLPARILGTGDPYPDQLRQTGEALTGAAGVDRWRVAWQSAGRTPEPWLGPDVLEAISEAASAGAAGVVVCPAGFTSDHLEVLYDLDIEARRAAEGLGLRFARTASLNDDPELCRTLAGVIMRAAAP
ncbi:MAG TPA: ferrochelatase [Acidimicrobiales bacterium]|nr:ferrochelatase [Acidimicrobiales bacterium]